MDWERMRTASLVGPPEIWQAGNWLASCGDKGHSSHWISIPACAQILETSASVVANTSADTTA